LTDTQQRAAIIDFDSPDSFPRELGQWDNSFENMILNKVTVNHNTKWWEIRSQLFDLDIKYYPIVENYLQSHMDTEVAISHVTRIIDIEQFKKEGLIESGGRGFAGENRIRKLLYSIGVDKAMTERIMSNVYYYWDRDKIDRTQGVHFQIDRKNILATPGSIEFASNLGGEILRRALEACDKNLYRIEPYKRLWIWGTPRIVKFRCKLANICSWSQASLLAEIVMYYIVTNLYGRDSSQYVFSFDGKTIDSVPPENIISTDEIPGFIAMQEQFDEYVGFYDELK